MLTWTRAELNQLKERTSADVLELSRKSASVVDANRLLGYVYASRYRNRTEVVDALAKTYLRGDEVLRALSERSTINPDGINFADDPIASRCFHDLRGVETLAPRSETLLGSLLYGNEKMLPGSEGW